MTESHSSKPEVKTLSVLDGTDFTVEVQRDSNGGYEVEVYAPTKVPKGNKYYPPRGLELIGSRLLEGSATQDDLESEVNSLIRDYTPSLVGTYTGGEKVTYG